MQITLTQIEMVYDADNYEFSILQSSQLTHSNNYLSKLRIQHFLLMLEWKHALRLCDERRYNLYHGALARAASGVWKVACKYTSISNLDSIACFY